MLWKFDSSIIKYFNLSVMLQNGRVIKIYYSADSTCVCSNVLD